MIDVMLAVWMVFFVIFLVANIITNNQIFGLMGSIILILLGLFIIVDGLQVNTGAEILDTASGATISWTYTDIELPYSTFSNVIGLPFLLFGVYMLYANLIKPNKKS